MLLKKSDSLSQLCYYTGFFLLILVLATLIISSAVFSVNGTMGSWQFPLGVSLAYLASYYFNYRGRENRVRLSLYVFVSLPLIIVIASLLVAAFFYDISYDGQAYHQEALIQLKNKWNPYYQYLPPHINQSIWINHYAKGMEMVQAAIYCCFGNIETAKATNLILWAGSFFMAAAYLLQSRLSAKKTFLISILTASSPVVFNQLLTFYVDGPLASMLLYLIVICLLIIREQSAKNLLLLASTIILLINVKFTGIFYLAVFIGGILIWLLYHKKYLISKMIWWTSVTAGMVALLIGFNPYIKNIVNFGHPLYPLMGDKTVNIINKLNLPTGFQHKSGPEKLFLATFSHTDNIYPWTDHKAKLKLPFTVDKVEIVTAPQVDTRIGGFGPMFSGVLILTAILFISLCFTIKDKVLRQNLCYITFIIIFSILVFPEGWWARYVPQFWFLPVSWLIAAELWNNTEYRLLKKLIYLALVVNVSFCFGGILINFTITQKINHELAILKLANKNIQVNWGASAGNRVRFWDKKIPYVVTRITPDMKYQYIASSEAIFVQMPPKVCNKIKKPFWLKHTEKWIPLRWAYYGRGRVL